MKRRISRKQYVVCIDNTGYEVSLERGKIYEVLPDPVGAGHGYLRITDESGEDYLFESEQFLPITVPEKLQKALESPPANNSLHGTRPRARRFAPRPAARP